MLVPNLDQHNSILLHRVNTLLSRYWPSVLNTSTLLLCSSQQLINHSTWCIQDSSYSPNLVQAGWHLPRLVAEVSYVSR